jgi:hypothetical protein
MRKGSSLFGPCLGLLFVTGVCAEETDPPRLEPLPVPEIPLNVDTSVSDDWSQAIDDIEFLDNSALARLKRMRELSFLTLADSENSRLFLGVNSDGLVGLHFRIK